jgi:aspartyl-tRNA(Asn)/glutamyl-tRNA(Gln) amidotransferase subunit C
MSKIGLAEVRRLAALANIGVTDQEAASLAVDLGQIVQYVEQLGESKTGQLPETDQVTGLKDVWRDDVVAPSPISQDELLSNAPLREGGYIKVRRVLE